MSDPDFEEQLRLEELEKLVQSGDASHVRRDKDGTEYVWDSDKKAWFPKIDDNFIAQYQMNYGTNDSAEKGDDPAAVTSSKETEYYNWYYYHSSRNQPGLANEQDTNSTQQTHDDYYRQYYQYYHNTNSDQSENSAAQDNTPSGGDKGSESASGQGSEEHREYTEQEWLDYYRYYGYDVSEYYADQVQVEDTQEQETEADKTNNDKKSEKRKNNEKEKNGENQSQGWFEVEEEKNTNVYVSGLPTDITEAEYLELMNKCGLIQNDPKTNKRKVKLYKDERGQPKGDGLCCYIKVESVELALQILDGSDVRGHKISVERAQFELKGKYDPSKRRKLTNKEKRKFRQKQEKLLDWRPEKIAEEGRAKHERVVVLKHMFDSAMFDHDPALINEIRNDIRSEGSKFGDVRKVVIYDRHPEGLVTVTFKEAEEADMCIAALNGRWFAKQKISAETWDGRTKYDIEESEAERNTRLKKWEDYLEGKGKSEGPKSDVPSDTDGKKADRQGQNNADSAADPETAQVAEAGTSREESSQVHIHQADITPEKAESSQVQGNIEAADSENIKD